MTPAVRSLALVAGCALAAGCQDEIGGSTVFIALQSDFAPFRGWTRVPLGDAPLEGHPPGPRFGYVKEKPAPGATEYPVGAMIVKTVESGSPEEWDVFAMTKRGGNFNRDGAVDWEFFLLRLTRDSVPVIVSRGTRPVDATDGGIGGYSNAAGAIGCNLCHGSLASEPTDHILSRALAPGAP